MRFKFISNDRKNQIIGINTDISGHPKTQSIVSVIQTTGVNPLEKKINLNNNDIFNEIKSIKDELKEVFFDTMTDETKNKIMEVQYFWGTSGSALQEDKLGETLRWSRFFS